MAIWKSGNSSDLLTINPTSKAARTTLYGSDGAVRVTKVGFRMASTGTFVAAAGTGAFLALTGSGSRIITVQRLLVTVPTPTAAAYLGVLARKWSGGISGGTVGASAITALDGSTSLASAVVASIYTAAPTTGLSVGALGNQLRLLQSSTAAAATIPDPFLWDFRDLGEAGGVVLRGRDEVLTLAFTSTPATAVTMSAEAEWIEQ